MASALLMTRAQSVASIVHFPPPPSPTSADDRSIPDHRAPVPAWSTLTRQSVSICRPLRRDVQTIRTKRAETHQSAAKPEI